MIKRKTKSLIISEEAIMNSLPSLSCLEAEDIAIARKEVLKYYDLLKDQTLSPEILLLHTLLKGRHFITVKETALFLGVSTKTVLREIARGNLKSYYMGNKHRIPLAGISDLLAMTDTFLN